MSRESISCAPHLLYVLAIPSAFFAYLVSAFLSFIHLVYVFAACRQRELHGFERPLVF